MSFQIRFICMLAVVTAGVGYSVTSEAQSRASKGIKTGKDAISMAAPDVVDLEDRTLNATALRESILNCARNNRYFDQATATCRTTDPVEVTFRQTGARTILTVQNPDGSVSTYDLDGEDGEATVIAAATPTPTSPTPTSPTPTDPTPTPTPTGSPQCGSASGVRVVSAPSSGLCSVGDAGSVTSQTTYQTTRSVWSWPCTDGTASTTCTAEKAAWWNADPRLYYTCSNGTVKSWSSELGKPSSCKGSWASSKGYSKQAPVPDSSNWGSVGNPTVSSCATLNEKGYIYDSYTDSYGNFNEKLQLVTCRVNSP